MIWFATLLLIKIILWSLGTIFVLAIILWGIGVILGVDGLDEYVKNAIRIPIGLCIFLLGLWLGILCIIWYYPLINKLGV